MIDDTWDGTLVLEKLAAIDKLDEFFDAVDEDNFALAEKLMKAARVDADSMAQVLRMMGEGES
jgi:hypothetical protein